MGLDMYLYRANREELEGWDNLNEEERERSIAMSPWNEVCYWRKANQIRNWIVENCEYPADGNCEEVELSKKDLEKLVDTCRKVIDNHELASELLPRSSGFFYGSQEYDEWYFEDLEDTISACERIIRDTDWKKEKVIYTDWW